MRDLAGGGLLHKFLAILAFCSVSIYCGAFWYVWPCRQSAVGRELRQGNRNSDLKPLMRSGQEAPCDEPSKQSLTEKSASTITAAGEVKLQRQRTTDEFENPWEGCPYWWKSQTPDCDPDACKEDPDGDKCTTTWKTSLDKGYQYVTAPNGLVACTHHEWTDGLKDSGRTVDPKFLTAYHKLEREATIKNITDPALTQTACNNEVCPKPKLAHEQLMKNALASEDELDSWVSDLESYCEEVKTKQGHEHQGHKHKCSDAFGAVHFADVENVMRRAHGLSPYPMDDPAFIFKHWIPICTKLHAEMKDKGTENPLSGPAFHTFATMDQVEALRTGGRNDQGGDCDVDWQLPTEGR